MSLFKNRTALSETALVGLIALCVPGMWNCITGMAGGIDPVVSSRATAALYAVFAMSGVIAPLIIRCIGGRLAMFLSALCYIVYTLSLMLYSPGSGGAFVIAAGALNGLAAGVFWAQQGTIWAYPTEETKGYYLGLFWVLFNLGGVIGGVITVASNWNNAASTASSTTYIAFMAVMGLGALLSLTMGKPEDVTKPDGSKVVVNHSESSGVELRLVCKTLAQPAVLLLVPLMIYSNFFYSYQFGGFNAKVFDARTQGMVLIFYWGAQMLGAPLVGKLHDNTQMSVRKRALVSFSLQALLVNISWGWGLYYELNNNSDGQLVDLQDGSAFWGPFCLMLLWGLLDSMVQNFAFWVLSQLSQEADQVTRYAGLFKTFQSAGSAVSWAIGGAGVSSKTQLIICWALFAVTILPTLLAAYKYLPAHHTDSDKVSKVLKELDDITVMGGVGGVGGVEEPEKEELLQQQVQVEMQQQQPKEVRFEPEVSV